MSRTLVWKYAIYAGIVSAALSTAGMVLVRIHSPRIITVLQSAYTAPATFHILHTTLTEAIAVNTYSASLLLQHIRQQIPSISAIRMRYDRAFHATCVVEQEPPFARINDTTILTARGHCVPCAEYTLVATEQLPHVFVREPLTDTVGALLQSVLQSIPPALLESHTLIWHNKTALELQPRTVDTYTLICWHKTVFTAELQDALQRVTALIAQRSKKNPRMQWRIDLRQAHYLMVTPLAKGKV